MALDNRKRALAEIVSLDAWHEDFTSARKAVDLHVDVAFAAGRIGSEPDVDVRFKLCLKRAEVVVVIPATEPATVDKTSVSRDAPQAELKSTEIKRTKSKIGGSARLSLTGDTSSSAFSLTGDSEASGTREHDRSLEISRVLKPLSVMQMTNADGDYAWIIEPVASQTLEGRPWDASKQPRLRICDARADQSRGIAPTVRIEIRCRREDLEISGIVLKDKSAWAALTRDPLGRNKTLAAEAVIRSRLFSSGLLSGDIRDPFAQMTISAVIAETH